MTTRSSFEGSDLHVTITELMLGYKKNWDITFPVLNLPPLLSLYLKDLALPRRYPLHPDILSCAHTKIAILHSHVEQMAPLLGLEVCFPVEKAEAPVPRDAEDPDLG